MISQKAIPLAIFFMFVVVFFNIKKEPYKKITANREDVEYVLYYGDDCSFSRSTLIYVQQKKIINLFPLVLKEVYYNEENLQNFYSLKKFCPKIEEKENSQELLLPVLFLTKEKKCLFGNNTINQYFDKMLK
jgi:hypothetical protein